MSSTRRSPLLPLITEIVVKITTCSKHTISPLYVNVVVNGALSSAVLQLHVQNHQKAHILKSIVTEKILATRNIIII